MKNQLNLTELLTIIQSKINSQDDKSYIKNLCQKGIENVAQKVGEESVEVVIASLLYQQHLLNNSAESAKYRQDMVQFRQNLVNFGYGSESNLKVGFGSELKGPGSATLLG